MVKVVMMVYHLDHNGDFPVQDSWYFPVGVGACRRE